MCSWPAGWPPRVWFKFSAGAHSASGVVVLPGAAGSLQHERGSSGAPTTVSGKEAKNVMSPRSLLVPQGGRGRSLAPHGHTAGAYSAGCTSTRSHSSSANVGPRHRERAVGAPIRAYKGITGRLRPHPLRWSGSIFLRSISSPLPSQLTRHRGQYHLTNVDESATLEQRPRHSRESSRARLVRACLAAS